jgi:hypothetical protein
VTAADPRWDEATAQLVAETREGHDTSTIRREAGKWDWECRDCGATTEGGQFGSHIGAVDAELRHSDAMILAALADAGLLLTPPMAEVLEAAKRLASDAGGRWQGDLDLRPLIAAAVDAWQAAADA